MMDLEVIMSLEDFAARYGKTVEATKGGVIAIKDLPSPGRPQRVILISDPPYGYDMVEWFDHYFNSVEPNPHFNGDEMVADFTGFKVHILAGSRARFAFPSLPEPEIIAQSYLKAVPLEEGNVVLDLGAYAGVSAWTFSKAVGRTGRVISVEPDPANWKCLVSNIEAHRMFNVTPVHVAVWTHDGMEDFQADGSLGAGFCWAMDRTYAKIPVQVRRLESIVRACSLDRIDLIKMDIEGAELAVLQDSVDLLSLYRPKLIVEPHRIHGFWITQHVIDLLKSMDYKVEMLDQDGTGDLIGAFPN